MSDRPIDPTALSDLWTLDPEVTFLNHGSFGACPRTVLAAQSRLREQLERQPVEFFLGSYEPLLDAARAALGQFVGADPDDLAFLPNATHGVNTVLRSLRFGLGDEILLTDHEYNATRNAVEFVARLAGAKVVVAPIPFPIESPEQVVEQVMAGVTSRTRLLVMDHVTSPTGLIMPIERILAALGDRGVDVLIDGAHAPGMLPLDLGRLGVAYYTGNCHKWICAPKGAAFLMVRRDRQPLIHPLAISHGANTASSQRSLFRQEFDWTGTHDPSPYLCVPEALNYLGSLLPGGWDEIRSRNHALALVARGILCATLGIAPPAPESMIGTLVAVPIPDGLPTPPNSPLFADSLRDELRRKYAIEVPVMPWPKAPQRLLRVSAQLYNRREHYEHLSHALRDLLDLR